MSLRLQIADGGCLVCSGPLHDTWLGAAVAMVPAVVAIILLVRLYVYLLRRWWWGQ